MLCFRLQYMYSERKKSPGTVRSGDSTLQITRRTKEEPSAQGRDEVGTVRGAMAASTDHPQDQT